MYTNAAKKEHTATSELWNNKMMNVQVIRVGMLL